MIQSRIVKTLKSLKAMTCDSLGAKLKSDFAIDLGADELREELNRLSDLQYVIIKDSNFVEYIP